MGRDHPGQYYDGARALLERCRANGDTATESIRVLNRELSDVVYRAITKDAAAQHQHEVLAAA